MERKSEQAETRLGLQEIDLDKILIFPRGLMGFEQMRRFTLLRLQPDSPFLILQCLDDPKLGLLVGDPYAFLPEYIVRIGDAEETLLQVSSPDQLSVLVTVSIPPGHPEKTTLNLTGPILVNHDNRLGLQVPQMDVNPPRVQLHLLAASETSGQADPTDKAGPPDPAD